jgi:hypothetical protein
MTVLVRHTTSSRRKQTSTWTKRRWGTLETCSKAHFINAFTCSQKSQVGSMFDEDRNTIFAYCYRARTCECR